MSDRRTRLHTFLRAAADERGRVRLTNLELADMTHSSVRNTARALSELVDAGKVRRTYDENRARILHL